MAKDEFVAATERAQRQLGRTHPATAARYNKRMGLIVIELGPGLALMLDPHQAEGLQGATSSQLSAIEISPSGLGLHFPKLDADLYVPGLLEGVLGSKKWMASRLGAAGGKRSSIAKKRASRANGKLGGRPRKIAG
jgi:hypothetical protein